MIPCSLKMEGAHNLKRDISFSVSFQEWEHRKGIENLTSIYFFQFDGFICLFLFTICIKMLHFSLDSVSCFWLKVELQNGKVFSKVMKNDELLFFLLIWFHFLSQGQLLGMLVVSCMLVTTHPNIYFLYRDRCAHLDADNLHSGTLIFLVCR